MLSNNQLLEGVENKFKELEGKPIYDGIFADDKLKELKDQVDKLNDWIAANKEKAPTAEKVEEARKAYNDEVVNANKYLTDKGVQLIVLNVYLIMLTRISKLIMLFRWRKINCCRPIRSIHSYRMKLERIYSNIFN